MQRDRTYQCHMGEYNAFSPPSHIFTAERGAGVREGHGQNISLKEAARKEAYVRARGGRKIGTAQGVCLDWADERGACMARWGYRFAMIQTAWTMPGT